MSDSERHTSRCPVCNGELQLDEDRGYFCPRCGWDEPSEDAEAEVWIVPEDRGDKEVD